LRRGAHNGKAPDHWRTPKRGREDALALRAWILECGGSAAFDYDANNAKGCTGTKPGVTESRDTPLRRHI
jgi:hypothetical protein